MQLQATLKNLQHSRFPVLNTYILIPYLAISWDTCHHHIWLFHDTAKCNYLTWTSYIKIYTCLSKTTIMHTLHINFYGCKWPMKKSYEKHWKTIVYLLITDRKITSIISLATLCKPTNMYNATGFLYVRDTYSHHICWSHDIDMVSTCTYVMILTSVIFWHEL